MLLRNTRTGREFQSTQEQYDALKKAGHAKNLVVVSSGYTPPELKGPPVPSPDPDQAPSGAPTEINSPTEDRPRKARRKQQSTGPEAGSVD